MQGKLLCELGMLEPLRERVAGGLPVLATCAGMILLAERVAQGDGPYLATVPMTVRRNAYGRQLDSFRTEGEVAGIGQVPMTFIRAPYVESVRPAPRYWPRSTAKRWPSAAATSWPSPSIPSSTSRTPCTKRSWG